MNTFMPYFVWQELSDEEKWEIYYEQSNTIIKAYEELDLYRLDNMDNNVIRIAKKILYDGYKEDNNV